jgi:hypothetical protein
MAKQTKTAPIGGAITRAVDLNLKKEDVLLLLMEGRKEVLEQEIQKLYLKQNELNIEGVKLRDIYKEECRKIINNLIPVEYQDFAKFLNASVNVEVLSSKYYKIEYDYYSTTSIGSNSNNGIMKVNNKQELNISSPFNLRFFIPYHPTGIEFKKTAVLNFNKEMAISVSSTFLSIYLGVGEVNQKEFEKLQSFKNLVKNYKEYAEIKSLHSNIVAEYDIFSKGGTRAKAQMIKASLAGDPEGEKILEVVNAASKGVKLLGNK